MKNTLYKKSWTLLFIFLLLLCSCGGGGSSASDNAGTSNAALNSASVNAGYVVFAWNDLGMHCLNPTYNEAVILPPYNNLVVQVVQKGNPPRIVTSGLAVEYRIINNTYSYGKTDTLGAQFSQFWDNVLALFGVTLSRDKGLNLVDPDIHNGLSGNMTAKADFFVANGIPATPVDDSGTWNPYQVAEITVKDSGGTIVAQTRATVPTSDEINCQKCHGPSAFADILQKHDALHGTSLVNQKPVLCAKCHGSPALGQSGAGSSGIYLSQAIHGAHAPRGATCYDCHPGVTTQCNRSIAHTAADGNCTTCHGTMSNVAGTIASGSRVPWSNEPKCATCHVNVSGVDTGSALFRNARGHGNLFCSGCHGSPHAMVPTSQASDNYQALQYQGKAKSLGSCGACHPGSRGNGINGFAGTHGGSSPEIQTACNICHTSVSTDTAQWPHAFQWQNR